MFSWSAFNGSEDIKDCLWGGLAWPCLGCCPACRLRTSVWDGECGGRVWPSVNGKQALHQAWMSCEWGENEEAQRPAETLQLEHPLVISHADIQYIASSGLLKNVRIHHLSKLFLSINHSYTIRRTDNSCML